MKIDLRKVYGLRKVVIEEEVTIPSDRYINIGVKLMPPVHVSGQVTVNYEDNLTLDLDLVGKFVMPCSITFEDVEVPFECKIEDEILENSLKDEFYLDLLDILWENIVLEIPFNVIKEGAELKDLQGEGWQVSKEE